MSPCYWNWHWQSVSWATGTVTRPCLWSYNFLTSSPLNENKSLSLPLFAQCTNQLTNQDPHTGLLLFIGMHTIDFLIFGSLIPDIVWMVAVVFLSQTMSSLLLFPLFKMQNLPIQVAFQSCPITVGSFNVQQKWKSPKMAAPNKLLEHSKLRQPQKHPLQ